MSLSLAICAGALAFGCAQPATPPADAQYVGQWLRSSLSFVRAERLGPPVASRISAYGAVALYEGYASDSASGLRSFAGRLNGLATLPEPSPGALDGATVAAEAIRIVLDSLFRDGFAKTRRTVDSLASSQVQGRITAGVTPGVST
ncbi:MAG: hypothetical protein ACT4P6_14105, partial [Gemmatimonadaceae bacterium]